jgi:hypothetical protein
MAKMAAKSSSQLIEMGLTLVYDTKGAPWYVDVKHPLWRNNVDLMMLAVAQMSADNQSIYRIPMWRRRKDLSECGDACFHHIREFHLRKSDRYKGGPYDGQPKPPRFDPMLTIEKYAVAANTAQEYRDQNLKFFRYYMMGDINSPVFCPIENILIDVQDFWGEQINNCWQQHHFVFVDSKSLQKDGQDPGKNNMTVDMSKPSDRARYVLEDTLRTIFLSATAHDKIHKRFDDGDITFYKNHQLPWALRNEANWIEFTNWLVSLGYQPFPSYRAWFDSLKIENNLHYLEDSSNQELTLTVLPFRFIEVAA